METHLFSEIRKNEALSISKTLFENSLWINQSEEETQKGFRYYADSGTIPLLGKYNQNFQKKNRIRIRTL